MTTFFSLSDLGLASGTSSLLADWLNQMQTQYPGYSPSSASLEYIQAQIFASQAADLAQLCSSGGTELFRTYGTTLVGISYQQGTAATAQIAITGAASSATLTVTANTLSVSGPITSISIVPPEYGIAAGSVTLTSGLNTQTFTTAGVIAGATNMPITSATPNFAYPAGTAITGTSAYALPALSQFTLDQLGFQTLVNYTINAGTTQTVMVTGIQTGALFNGAGSGGSIQSVQQLPWIGTLALVTAATGGTDPEDDTHYLNRLTTALQLQAPRPITAADFATIATSFVPAEGTDQQDVGRATALDGYDPNTATLNNTRTVTVCATDASGFALNTDTLYGYPTGTSGAPITTAPSPTSGWGVEGWLLSLREVNFVVNVISPTYSGVYVTVTVKAATGWDQLSVQSAVQSALLSFLSPSAWGLPPSSATGWQNTTTIYQSDILSTIQSVAAVDHVVSGTLAMGLSPAPAVSPNDLALPGPVALPTSSTTTIPTSAITVT